MCSHTNTVHTFYGGLHISLWDVFRITGLPIFLEMFGEIFPYSSIIMNKKVPPFLSLLFERWEGLFEVDKRPKYTDWVKAFVEDHPNYPRRIILVRRRRRRLSC